MQLEITKDINLNNYSATFNVIDITEQDTEKINDYGVLKISIGGDIPITIDGTETTFKMSEEIKEFPTGLPFTKTFKDTQYNGKGKDYAVAYNAEIAKRAKALIAEINARIDDYSGVEIIQL